MFDDFVMMLMGAAIGFALAKFLEARGVKTD